MAAVAEWIPALISNISSNVPSAPTIIPVAKRTSVFYDPTIEIQELTAVIKQDISALNAAVVDLQLLSNSQNESGSMSTDTMTHTTTVTTLKIA
ncbi:PREDICTED: syntaxin-32-like [Ipomoea nil]|uniref:syntaxin-32-like n=1 Tax=Ipomoea nil TaxID=35883 RepID=UPI000901AE53|nr:PREDICTED: syntaxin-32-like [Ipomoea nil]